MEDVEGCQGCYLNWLGSLGGGFWQGEMLEEKRRGALIGEMGDGGDDGGG